MNLISWLCCREKPKTQQNKPLIITVKKPVPTTAVSDEKFCSQPFDLADKYKGEQRNGVANGHGQMMYKNGDYYRGEWVNGQKQGRGLQIYNQKGYRYEGEWKANLPNGQGKAAYWDGSYYAGQFKDSNRHGKGEFFDAESKRHLDQIYQNGILLKQKLKQGAVSRQEQFPTLVLDKQRFNSEDLQHFQKQNPQIKQLQVQFLLKYYAICKIIKLPFIKKPIKQWDDKEVRQFLQIINLSKYKEIFYKNKVKGKTLITITEKQMIQDFNMKLGDRKRLGNYCRCLGQIFNDQKKKKDSKRNQSTKQLSIDGKKGSSSSIKSSRFKTAYIDQGDIIQQQNEQDSSKQNFQNLMNQQQIQMSSSNNHAQGPSNNYQTEQWNEHYSNQLFSLNQPLNNNMFEFEMQDNIPKSQKSSSSRSKSSKGSILKNASLRKKSKEEYDDDLFGNIPPKIKLNVSQIVMPLPDHEREKLKHQKHQKHQKHEKHQKHDSHRQSNKSRTSSSPSSSQTENDSDEVPDFTRKKTTGTRGNKEGGMQIRELYEFLKQRGNLQFIIKQREIELLQLIGEGGYGKVYKGKYMSCPVAVKDYIKTRKHQNQEDFLKELEILSSLKHPNIVLYMGICITTDKYQLVTEYLENGSLFDQLHKKKKQFTKEETYQIVDDIVKGMVYLHNMKNIMHRDLKSSNVLLDEDLKVKLCDFGLSGHRKKSKKKSQCRIGTYQWMAPEVMKKQQMDLFSDVYSFGVILWQLLTNKIPYEGYTQHQIIGSVGFDENHKLKFETTGSIWTNDDLIVKLMDQCLNRKTGLRPTFIQIQQRLDTYLDEVDEAKERNNRAR